MFWRNQEAPRESKTALLLSGGGARAAYQVGVLKAVAEILPKETPNPFPIICGTSAGAINATALAIFAPKFRAWYMFGETFMYTRFSEVTLRVYQQVPCTG